MGETSLFPVLTTAHIPNAAKHQETGKRNASSCSEHHYLKGINELTNEKGNLGSQKNCFIKGVNAGKVVTKKHMEGAWGYNMVSQCKYLGAQILEEKNKEQLRCQS